MSIIYSKPKSRFIEQDEITSKLHTYTNKDRKIHVVIQITIDHNPSNHIICDEFTGIIFVRDGDPIVNKYEDLPEYSKHDLQIITDYLLENFLSEYPGYYLQDIFYSFYDTDCEKFVGKVNKYIGS